jgi:hypothetical protein
MSRSSRAGRFEYLGVADVQRPFAGEQAAKIVGDQT